MPRPTKERKIGCHPGRRVFRPAGIPLRKAEIILMSLDELEAIRLADVEGLRHEAAAELMGTSRPTLTRILNTARNKAGRALVESRPLVIEGGNIKVGAEFELTCRRCNEVVDSRLDSGRSWKCPKCGKQELPGGGK